MAFGDITLNSNIAQYYANPFAQCFCVPNYFSFTPQYQNFFNFDQYFYNPYQTMNYFNFNGFGYFNYFNTPYNNIFSSNYYDNNLNSYSNNNFDNVTFDYVWNDLGLDISHKKTSIKDKKNDKKEETEIDNSSKLNLSKEELAKIGFDTPNLRERWKHLTPEFQKALIKLTKYAEKNGIKISYGKRSTWRSHHDQIELKNERGSYAAQPGHSPHEQGIAVDITTTSINGNTRSNRENQALLGAYWESLGYRWGGHFKNFTKEPWHFDLKPTKS